MNKQSITKIYKSDEIYSSELDMLMRDEILGKNWSDGEWPDTITLDRKNNKWHGESEPIKIDFVINALEKLKKDGCNYVEIMFHEDHHGYYFNGLDIHRSTESELAAEEERINIITEKNKEKEIRELEAKLAKLKK